MTWCVRIAALAMALLAEAGQAGDVASGRYRAVQGPEMASHLEIGEDGRFAYALSYGALDERAEGRWTRMERGIALTTVPKPQPPEFRLDHAGPQGEGDAALFVLVRWPDGRGIAGVDVRLGLNTGAVVEGYTQEYGWSLGDLGTALPQWIELADPYHGFRSARFAISKEVRSMIVTLVPHDMGIAAFEGVLLEGGTEGEAVLHHPMGDIRYRRVQK